MQLQLFERNIDLHAIQTVTWLMYDCHEFLELFLFEK